MISIDDHPPPDPSSSHHHHRKQQISHDLNVSDIDLKSPDADLHHTNNQLPNFSIRDYVFGLRSKDVACNWPFSSTSLQLCLKNGVKNLLPPFQPLDLLRDNSSINRSSLENRLPDEEIMNNFDGKSTDNQFKSIEKRALKSVIKNSSGSKQDNRLTHVKSKEKPPASSSQNTINIKKSRLVMKLNLGVEPVDEIDPSSFIVSETMASKICPVCKTFSSSSNTTLNAHIDQCLTGEGTMKWTDNPKVVIKHRIKSRKTRLMVDVYKTAPHCTVEELDRRNGTSWATNSSFPAQEFQFQGEEEEEEEKQEPKITTVNRRVADNEGDVYIETDGTKVRILSVPKPGSSSDNNGARRLLKGVKGNKFLISKKKNNLFKQKHHQKYLKVSPHARKLRSLKPQAKSLQEEDVPTAENCSKDERPEEPVKARVETKMGDLAIVRPPWACSKRTHRVKKFIGKLKHQKLELQCRIESDKSSSPPHSSDKVDSSQSRKKLRTSSPLIRQPLTFRNENIRMHEDCEDSPDSSDSKFPSLKKNLSFPAAKFNLKRKSCTVEKSFDGAFQDSLKEHATVRKNKETRSVDSKSSNEESSSIRVETADGDASHDIESVRNETISNLDQVSTVPPSNFMGLSNSFDPEFSKQECVDLYQDQQLLCSTNRAPDVEKYDFFFQEDDPIPIPGPPGSFLPSPGGGEDTVSEEQLQVISSLTTTVRVLTAENEHHHDQDSMSNSPVSTVSNPSLARSDSRSTSVQDDHIRHGISSFMVPKSGEYSDPSPASFKNDQPCCCSRKDSAFSYTLPPYYQESSMIRKQPIESKSMINGFNFRSEPPETAIFPTMNKLPVYNDCDSAASPSKPVLRLMGKNLTVVKTDDDSFRPPQASQQPVIFSQYQNGSDSQHFNGYPPVNMRRNTDSRVSHGSFMTPVNRYYGYGGEHTVPQTRSHHGNNNTSSTSKIIIIDDSPENIPDDSMRNEILRRNRVGQVNPLYTMYQAQSSGHLYGGGGGGSTVFRGGGFQTSLTNGDLNLNKWNVAGSSSSSPSRSTHFRSSSVYYPPSYP